MREVAPVRERETENPELESSSASIAEEMQLESLQTRVDADALDQTRSQLIANLVHDLRTPLVSIRGYTKMILEERAGTINSTQREYLTIVTENTNRLVQMLNSLLQLATTQPLHFETLDMRSLWQAALAVVRPHAQQKSVKVIERIPAEPLVILGDKQKLMEVFTNLLSNAVKFTDQGGEVALELSGKNEGEATVTISDTGVGIPAELVEKFVERMSPPDGSSATIRESLGVGLSVVHDIIRLHGGRLSVSSKAEEGVTVFITLPAL
jgi:two-component system phosphate regulon sensor histidine kinase PhoR